MYVEWSTSLQNTKNNCMLVWFYYSVLVTSKFTFNSWTPLFWTPTFSFHIFSGHRRNVSSKYYTHILHGQISSHVSWTLNLTLGITSPPPTSIHTWSARCPTVIFFLRLPKHLQTCNIFIFHKKMWVISHNFDWSC